MTTKARLALVLATVLPTVAGAQAPVPPTPADTPRVAADSAPNGETTIALDVGFGVRGVMPARVIVPPGDTVRITVPRLGDDVQYIWTKNGDSIPGQNTNVLTFNRVSSSDTGSYVCLFSTPTTLPRPSQYLILTTGLPDRLINISTRGHVGAAPDQGLVSGFVVTTALQSKKVIIRAVGPSLGRFGVTDPLRRPVLRIYNSSGELHEDHYVYPAVIGGPTYESDLAESLARTGAFPLPPDTLDVVVMKPFRAGTYTAHVTSGDGSAGAVLLELYEVP